MHNVGRIGLCVSSQSFNIVDGFPHYKCSIPNEDLLKVSQWTAGHKNKENQTKKMKILPAAARWRHYRPWKGFLRAAAAISLVIQTPPNSKRASRVHRQGRPRRSRRKFHKFFPPCRRSSLAASLGRQARWRAPPTCCTFTVPGELLQLVSESDQVEARMAEQ